MRHTRRSIAARTIAIVAVIVTLAGCAPSPVPDRFAIAGGGVTGVYYSFGAELAEEYSARFGAAVTVDETNGSVDNLQRVGDGRALLGFAQSDAAADAVAGAGAFPEPLPVAAIARLYDEYVHVIVRSDSDVARLADLEGRAVSLGASGSGVNLVARRVLDAAGVSPANVTDEELGLAESIAALRAGDIEAFFWVGGLPTPGLTELFADTPSRLLSIESATVERVNAEHGGVYRLAEFPIGAYGRAEATATMTVPNYLMVADSTSDDEVVALLTSLFDSRSRIAADVPAAALLDRRQAIFTDPVSLHPGAVAYYRDARD